MRTIPRVSLGGCSIPKEIFALEPLEWRHADKITIDSPGIIGLIWTPFHSAPLFFIPFLPSGAIIGTAATTEIELLVQPRQHLEAIVSPIIFILYLRCRMSRTSRSIFPRNIIINFAPYLREDIQDLSARSFLFAPVELLEI